MNAVKTVKLETAFGPLHVDFAVAALTRVAGLAAKKAERIAQKVAERNAELEAPVEGYKVGDRVKHASLVEDGVSGCSLGEGEVVGFLGGLVKVKFDKDGAEVYCASKRVMVQ